MQQQSPILHVLYQELDGLVQKFLLRFMNSEYVYAAEHVSQVCSDNSEEYLPLHEVFVGHNTLSYLEEEDGLSSEDVRTFRETIQAWWIAAAKGAVTRSTYESQVTLQSQMASTRLTTIQYGWSGACCSRVCSSGSSSW